MNIVLTSLTYEQDGCVRGLFRDEQGNSVAARFRIDDGDGGVSEVQPDVFLNCGASAEQVRTIIKAVSTFACAARQSQTRY
jgi:hypothetical protein